MQSQCLWNTMLRPNSGSLKHNPQHSQSPGPAKKLDAGMTHREPRGSLRREKQKQMFPRSLPICYERNRP
jgi:hypothetical protein